jgi:hypothetical protein
VFKYKNSPRIWIIAKSSYTRGNVLYAENHPKRRVLLSKEAQNQPRRRNSRISKDILLDKEDKEEKLSMDEELPLVQNRHRRKSLKNEKTS